MESLWRRVSWSAPCSDQTAAAPLRSLPLFPRRWPVAKGADKELVDAKTKVCDLVIESLTLSSPREEERLEELRRLSWVRLRCSWEHRYDNGTDPVSLWLIMRTYPCKHVSVRCGCRAMLMSYINVPSEWKKNVLYRWSRFNRAMTQRNWSERQQSFESIQFHTVWRWNHWPKCI